MEKIGQELLADIDKETVEYQPNYDDKELEPTVLPTKLPNLLVNGAAGIAVGMATNIPPHNLKRDRHRHHRVIKNPAITGGRAAGDGPRPDFPTGGIICSRGGNSFGYSMAAAPFGALQNEH
jgi:DNA gyrase subunit A